MSTLVKTILHGLAVVFIGIFLIANSYSQDIEINISLLSTGSDQFLVNGVFKNGPKLVERNWVFPDSYSDAEQLAKRISKLNIVDEQGDIIPYKEFAPGEFVAERKASRFSYQIDLSIPEKPTSAAHVSWVGKSRGFFMLNDILPRMNKSDGFALVSFKLPAGWRISTSEKKITEFQYEVKDTSNALFLAGKDWREKHEIIGGEDLSISIGGDWQFSDDQAFDMAKSIFTEYRRLLGSTGREARIFLTPFPKDVEFDRWRAETRGENVQIVSSKASFQSQALQRLHEQLRHEILHLWIPNSLNLTGDYAWFYEGFVVYQALKSGVWLGQIRFEDFLNTLNQANYLNERRNIKSSLMEISKNRWSESTSSVYARGMLVGFLSDLAMLKKSGNKVDISALFAELLKQNGRSSKPEDATSSIIKLFTDYPELNSIVENYIKADRKINWNEHLSSTGMEFQHKSTSGKIVIKKDLRGREKALLTKLGYNRWRKLQGSIY